MNPYVMAAAASARPSGSSRIRVRNTSASVAAMIKRAAPSRMKIECCTVEASASTTTGMPVTM